MNSYAEGVIDFNFLLIHSEKLTETRLNDLLLFDRIFAYSNLVSALQSLNEKRADKFSSALAKLKLPDRAGTLNGTICHFLKKFKLGSAMVADMYTFPCMWVKFQEELAALEAERLSRRHAAVRLNLPRPTLINDSILRSSTSQLDDIQKAEELIKQEMIIMMRCVVIILRCVIVAW